MICSRTTQCRTFLQHHQHIPDKYSVDIYKEATTNEAMYIPLLRPFHLDFPLAREHFLLRGKKDFWSIKTPSQRSLQGQVKKNWGEMANPGLPGKWLSKYGVCLTPPTMSPWTHNSLIPSISITFNTFANQSLSYSTHLSHLATLTYCYWVTELRFYTRLNKKQVI